LQRAITLAGQRSSIFRPTAVARIHELAEGVPRRVKQLSDLSLVAAAGQELPGVDVETVEATYEELGVVATTSPASGPSLSVVSLAPAATAPSDAVPFVPSNS
jgi:hypothetical protein